MRERPASLERKRGGGGGGPDEIERADICAHTSMCRAGPYPGPDSLTRTVSSPPDPVQLPSPLPPSGLVYSTPVFSSCLPGGGGGGGRPERDRDSELKFLCTHPGAKPQSRLLEKHEFSTDGKVGLVRGACLPGHGALPPRIPPPGQCSSALHTRCALQCPCDRHTQASWRRVCAR
jgi:hypothetical protein